MSEDLYEQAAKWAEQAVKWGAGAGAAAVSFLAGLRYMRHRDRKRSPELVMQDPRKVTREEWHELAQRVNVHGFELEKKGRELEKVAQDIQRLDGDMEEILESLGKYREQAGEATATLIRLEERIGGHLQRAERDRTEILARIDKVEQQRGARR